MHDRAEFEIIEELYDINDINMLYSNLSYIRKMRKNTGTLKIFSHGILRSGLLYHGPPYTMQFSKCNKELLK